MYGSMGAATATILARFVAGCLSKLFMSRKIFVMQTRSLLLAGLYRLAKQMLVDAEHEGDETL